jgi:hypothetical protein
MKIEQNIMTFSNADDAQTGYIDLPRALSAVNGKSIAQTKRHDGKYKPLGYVVRVRAIVGTVIVKALNCGYPTRNSVVLAGAARDAMLKSAGISRSNLESYQKELRLLMDTSMVGSGSNIFFPQGTDVGTGKGGLGDGFDYDYTKLVINQPDAADTGITKAMAMIGTQSASDADWDADSKFFVVDNWLKFRHSFTPSATADDIANNVFSWAMSQGETAGDIIDMVDDNADEKPYDLSEFTSSDSLQYYAAGTGVGNPTTEVFTAPLGLLQIICTGTAQWNVEVVGVTEL